MSKKKSIGERFYDVVLNRSEHDACAWLKNIEKRYQAEKENISFKLDDELRELFTAVSEFQDEYGGFPEGVANELNKASWMKYVDDKLTEELQKEIDVTVEQLEPAEKASYEELLDIIWNMDNRRSITATYYDYEEDAFAEYEDEIPRSFHNESEKEGSYMCLKKDLAHLVYNRAGIIIRAYLPKNQFDVYGVIFDSKGDWQPVKAKDLKESFMYDHETGAPIPIRKNDNFKELPKAPGIIKFPGKKLKENFDPDFKVFKEKS